MHRQRSSISHVTLALALTLSTACFAAPDDGSHDEAPDEAFDEDVTTGDPAAIEEAADAVDVADEAQSAETPDQVIVDEPAGAPAIGGEAAPFGGIAGNFTGGDVSAQLAAPDDAALAKMASAEAAAASSCTNPGEPTKKVLGLTQYGQQKGYYCGPATGYMIIRYLHGAGYKSRKNGASLSQGNLAGSAHMRTEADHGTPWDKKNFAKGLNAWRGQNWYVQVARPSTSLFKAALSHSIGTNGMPVAADTVEFAGGVHYNGHPVNRTIGHWIVAYGYDGCGKKVYFADPATSVWSSVKPKFTYESKLFASRFLQSNGIVY